MKEIGENKPEVVVFLRLRKRKAATALQLESSDAKLRKLRK